MTTGNTSLLGLALPVEGELDGTWGDVVNDSITSLVDSAVAGTTTLSADADVTLTDTVLAANQARQAVILWTASNGATTRNITAPARSKPYIVINAGTGSVVLRGAGPTTGVTIVSGEKCLAAWNGSDFVKIGSTSGAGTFTDLTVSGSATFSGGTANAVAYLNGSKVLTTGSALTFDGSQLSVNGGAGGIPLSLNANTGGNTNLFFSEGGVAKWYLRNITGNGGFSFYDVNAGSESIRLTATGLGIGTSSPAAKLDVAGDYKEGVVTANTGTAYTISLASGTVQILTLTGNCTFTFPTATAGKSFTLLLRQDGTGGRTVTWPAAVKWPGGTAPTITSTASRQDKYIFTADGTNFYGSNAGQNYTV